MPWPIPELLKIEQPEPISWRAWLPTLFVVGLTAVGAVLLLWPRSRSTHTLEFWMWLVGAPLATCFFALGVVIDRWESAKVHAEEEEREQERILSLWQQWCKQHLCVGAAVAITTVPTANFSDKNVSLPVNKGRAKGLIWRTGKAAGEQYNNVVSELAKRLTEVLKHRREIAVTLLHNEISTQIAGFKSELKSAFEKAVPGVRLSVTCEPVVECAQWIARQIDGANDAAKLIVAVQIWPEGESAHTFSEGVAAILLEPGKKEMRNWLADRTTSQVVNPGATRILRPMATASDKLEADVAQMVEMQAAPNLTTHFWHTGCGDDLSSAIQSAIKADPKNPVMECSFDHIVGLPGPASSWLMLATALEATRPGSPPELLASRDTTSEQLHLCMIAPAARKQDSEGTRSES